MWWFDLYHLSVFVDLVENRSCHTVCLFSSQLELFSNNSLAALSSWSKRHFVLNTWQAKQEHIQSGLSKTQKIKSNFGSYIRI